MAKFIEVHSDDDSILVNLDNVDEIIPLRCGERSLIIFSQIMPDRFCDDDFMVTQETNESYYEMKDIVARATGIISSVNKSRTSGVE